MTVQSAVNINVDTLLGAPVHDASALLDWFSLVDNFMQRPVVNVSISIATNLNWELLGTNTPASAFNAGGGVTLTTDANAGDDTVVWPHQDTTQTSLNAIAWDLSTPTVHDALIKPTAVAAQTLYSGFKLTSTLDLTTDANQIFFYSTAGGNWQLATSIAGVDALTDLGVAPTDLNPQRLTLISGYLAADGTTEQVRAFIDGTLVATVDSPDTGTLLPFVGVEGNAQSSVLRALKVGIQYDIV